MNYKYFLAFVLTASIIFISCTEKIVEYRTVNPNDKPTVNDQFHGDIVGRVLQKNSGAKVYINQVNVVDSALIDPNDGSFAFNSIQIGNYDMTVKAANYRLYKRYNVIVTGGGVVYVGDFDLSKTPDLVSSYYPQDKAEVVYDNRYARLSVSVMFTQPMDRKSVEEAFSTNPPTKGVFHWGVYAPTLQYAYYYRDMSFSPIEYGAVITTYSKITSFTYSIAKVNSYVDTTYTITLGTGAKDTAGNHLQFPLTFSFSTVQAGYTVYGIQSDPIDGDIDVQPLTYDGITVTFPRRMNKHSTQQAVSITPNDSRIFVWPDSNRMKIYLGGVFRADTTYHVSIDSTALDLDGNKLGEQFAFSFRTASVALSNTYPTNAELFVSTGAYVRMNFNTYVLKSSVETAFSISPNVAGTFVWGDGYYNSDSKTQLTFKPSSPLQANTLYTVTVQNTVRDLFGTPMRESYSFSFVTRPN